MQEASERTVEGDFNDARFGYAGVTSRFYRRGGGFFVVTDGADGKPAEYRVAQTFGVDPLQQYLIDLPGGRKQALSIAWDTRKKRWFHLYPTERIDFRDGLHWTQPSQNWNFMCGECHATDYRKNYDPVANRYQTVATRYDVGCQACHGPASRHLEWAAKIPPKTPPRPAGEASRDFDVALSSGGTAQLDGCAHCHSRRATLTADHRQGAALMDTHLPALLTAPLYFADGQIEDEVYEYGSFLQSKMHLKGVVCSDCHEPHSGKVRAAGNAVCVTCHNAAAPGATPRVDTSGLKRKDYDSPAHHFHPPGAPGSRCVDCHAPTRDYMVVHPRHDHSFRIPRPDVSVAIGTPNACTGCHADRPATWAAETVAKWYGPGRRQEPHYGQALDAGRRGKPGAVRSLVALCDDRAVPAIVRATALELLERYPGPASLAALRRSLTDADPMVRRAAVTGHDGLAAPGSVEAVAPLLDDPVRGVRVEAARVLASAGSSLTPSRRRSLARALGELEAAQVENADRPEALASLGNLFLSRGDPAEAERYFRKAIALDARFAPAYVNLADLYRARQREAAAERVVREGLTVLPAAAPLREALGLTLVRQGKKPAALAEFAAAAKAAPDEPRHVYVYAVSLHDAGRGPEAIQVLEDAVRRTADRDLLLTLAFFLSEAGDRAGAEKHLRALALVNPDDPALAATGLRP